MQEATVAALSHVGRWQRGSKWVISKGSVGSYQEYPALGSVKMTQSS